MTRQVRIDRLELYLRGIPPATAEAAGRLLGPALARALGSRSDVGARAMSVDAGRLDVAGGAAPRTLADQMAGRIARRLTGDRS